MRHELLFFLYSSISRIKGVGGATASSLQRLLPAATVLDGSGMPIVRDLIFHLPVGLVDRRFTCPLNTAPDGVVATFVITVESHLPPPPGIRRGSRRPYKVMCYNDTGEITLVFFNPREDYVKQVLPVGSRRAISGRIDHFENHLQMTHPDIIAPVDKLAEVQKPEPVYPLTIGLTSRRIAKFIATAMEKLPDLPEWTELSWVKTHKWPTWKEAINAAHHPLLPEDLEVASLPRERLAYDEMLANQLYLALVRRHMQQQPGDIIRGTGKLAEALVARLPFTLTGGQQSVMKEIADDMTSGRRMCRLLQGDVGSGKTIVALLAILRVVEDGKQAALMVPTEIIAQQHYKTLSALIEPLGIKVALLTGSVKGKARKELLEGLASGDIPVVVGTHALFQEQVNFSHLSLVVIDEQHRFGVSQRMALTAKGNAPHLLHMTATPIPRSLTMTLYGDMECSNLREKPAERQPVTTRVIPLSRYDEVMERLKSAIAAGEKVYWICPLIEEKYIEGELELTPEGDLAAAETRFREFKKRFGDVVGLVHGRMKSDVRNEEMQRFSSGELRLLVATTVIEVGVDVRDATIIVIEQSERFGLSQLHQLRGRVGRGNKASACVLLYSDRAGDVARSRLAILRDSNDGFAIAEADLNIRGGGDLLGTRQSGLPRFIFTDLVRHQALLEHARDDAANLVATDPHLQGQRGVALEILLQLFGFEFQRQSDAEPLASARAAQS
jgi:ATP-dependent DNA helicase RecG